MNQPDTQHESHTKHQLVIPARTHTEAFMYEGNSIKDKVFASMGAVAVMGLAGIGVYVQFVQQTPEPVAAIAPIIQESVPVPPKSANPFDTVFVTAKSAIVYDVNQDTVLYGKKEDEQLPLASVTKLMTALLALETLEYESNIAIAPEAIQTEGDSGLLANETWKVGDLVGFTMITSSNDGAGALAASAGTAWSHSGYIHETSTIDTFVQRMNTRAQELGLTNTIYRNPTGLDEELAGGLGTAEDMSKLLAYIWENEPAVIKDTTVFQKEFVSEDNFVHLAENTNTTVYTIPGLLGGKTGYTDMAGGNLAVIYDAGLNHPIAIVVLGSTIDGRFSDVQTLVDATYEYVESGWHEYDHEISGSSASSL